MLFFFYYGPIDILYIIWYSPAIKFMNKFDLLTTIYFFTEIPNPIIRSRYHV